MQTTSIRPELLKLLIGKNEDHDETDFLKKITYAFNLIVNNDVPTEVHELLRDTQGIPLTKKDGDIRPIGLREGYTNIAIKAALKQINTEQIFDGINYALAGKNQMDSLIGISKHSFIATPKHDKIFIDFKNSFNNSDRNPAAKAILEECPDLGYLYYFLYSKASNIWLKDETSDWKALMIETGCVQGCVLGPYVFGFATLEAYRSAKQTLNNKPDAIFGAFSDDVFISALTTDSILAFNTLTDECKACGLSVNFKPGKTVVLLGECDDSLEVGPKIEQYMRLGFPLENIRIHPNNGGDNNLYGYIHLGIPQGSDEYQKIALKKMVDNLILSSKCDEIIDEVQEKWVYLSLCVKQKPLFWLRHMCPSITNGILSDVDNIIRLKFNEIIG